MSIFGTLSKVAPCVVLLIVVFTAVINHKNLNSSYVNSSLRASITTAYSQPSQTITKRPRIAIMSSFVPNANTNTNEPPPRLNEEYFPHILTKACYSYIWGYDFIFNTTYGFDDTYPKWHWLDFGTWHRVPHVESRIREFDWILYTDTDFLIQDITRPLESFLSEFELHGKDNVQLFIPTDQWQKDFFTFSAYAFMIRNSPYGLDLLKHWDTFARGICPRGNMNKTSDGKYDWMDTDQPGLWYSMMRTYADYFPDRVPNDNYPKCNATTGVLDFRPPPWNNFFKKMPNITKGSTGSELDRVPDDQPYIFSSLHDGPRSGLGLQLTWGEYAANDKKTDKKKEAYDQAFALHVKKFKDAPSRAHFEVEHCKQKYGCYAHYNEAGELKIGCGEKVYL